MMNQISIGARKLTPSKIVCIGRNYVAHIEELANEIPDDMVVFLKPNSAISGELLSFHQEPIHFEGELSFVVENNAFSAVGFGLDLTKRALQGKLKSKGLPWERAKAFDGSAVFSDFVELCELSQHLALELRINHQITQAGGIDLMMYKPTQILKELQTFMSLNDGDIIMTGTPEGVGIINKGDLFEGKIIQNDETLVSAQWTAQ